MHDRRLPDWLKKPRGGPSRFEETDLAIEQAMLHTVCRSARCPNIGECYSRGTATFMILGDRCTRNCGFCAVAHAKPSAVDPDEPRRVAETVKCLGLRFVVVTSVARDDLADGGASQFAATLRAIRAMNPEVRTEVLVPDFRGSREASRAVVEAEPDVLNHNVETVERLSPSVRPQARYRRSLEVLRVAKELDSQLTTKSGIMVGLGETEEELEQTMRDLRSVGCDCLTIGQYLQSDSRKLPVRSYVPPERFDALRDRARGLGFRYVAAGPFVRSSYLAETAWEVVTHGRS